MGVSSRRNPPPENSTPPTCPIGVIIRLMQRSSETVKHVEGISRNHAVIFDVSELLRNQKIAINFPSISRPTLERG